MKLYYEKELIQNLDDINSVLVILTSNDYPLKPSLKKRVEKELPIVKRKLAQKKMHEQLKVLERSVSILFPPSQNKIAP